MHYVIQPERSATEGARDAAHKTARATKDAGRTVAEETKAAAARTKEAAGAVCALNSIN